MADLHPLQRAWTLWYDSPSTYNVENWELSLIPIMTVHTVEEFFMMLKYMKPLHALRTSSQYSLFKEGVKPMWEDPANKEGGKVWLNIDIVKNASAAPSTDAADAQSEEKTDLDKMWENVLMAVIGEYLQDRKEEEGEPQIMGVVASKRKYHNRLAVWVKDSTKTDAIESIKKNIQREMSLPPNASIVFTKHGDK